VAEPPLAPYVPEPGTLAKLTPVQAFLLWLFGPFILYGYL
jgi:hypothetical protein